ncbi:MAG TPA: hypothetical protein VN259_15835 [Xanthomonadales bacterium]|nr:hypothetical protein [Xanthomonadales bacterium]
MNKFTIALLLTTLPFGVSAQTVIGAEHGAEAEHVDAAVQQYAAKKGIAGPVAYDVAFHDINTDSRRDAVVLVNSGAWCDADGGCALLVLEGRPNSFFVVSKTDGVSKPVRVLPTDQRSGWQSLIVNLKASGDTLLRAVNYKYPVKLDKLIVPDAGQLAKAVTLIE